jgi:hypothetical protein
MAIHGNGFILQRKLSGHDRGRWRSVGRFKPGDMPAVEKAAAAIFRLLEPSSLRVVFDNMEQPIVKEIQTCE